MRVQSPELTSLVVEGLHQRLVRQALLDGVVSLPVSIRSRSAARCILPENPRDASQNTGATAQATSASCQPITNAAALNSVALTVEVATPSTPEEATPRSPPRPR
jgi:hypothetical protein